jgi:pyruvate carboxylase subunit B
MYTNKSSQFIGLVKGDYGHTPVKIDPAFRMKICGFSEEIPYDTSAYKMQPNPELPEAGGVKLAENEKEELLLELFPMVAKNYLTAIKKKAYEAAQQKEAQKAETAAKNEAEARAIIEAQKIKPITGKTVEAPLPGRIIDINVKVGDTVAAGQQVAVLEAMKMENAIPTNYGGVVKQVLVAVGDTVPAGGVIIEVE